MSPAFGGNVQVEQCSTLTVGEKYFNESFTTLAQVSVIFLITAASFIIVNEVFFCAGGVKQISLVSAVS